MAASVAWSASIPACWDLIAEPIVLIEMRRLRRFCLTFASRLVMCVRCQSSTSMRCRTAAACERWLETDAPDAPAGAIPAPAAVAVISMIQAMRLRVFAVVSPPLSAGTLPRPAHPGNRLPSLHERVCARLRRFLPGCSKHRHSEQAQPTAGRAERVEPRANGPGRPCPGVASGRRHRYTRPLGAPSGAHELIDIRRNDIETSCAVCGRTLLLGERLVPYESPEGAETRVCELCVDQADALGWIREGSISVP